LYRVAIRGEPQAIEAAAIDWFEPESASSSVELSPADAELLKQLR